MNFQLPHARLTGFFAVLAVSCGPSNVVVDNNKEVSFNDEAPVTWVDHSKVERQSIGNCWIYATTGWAESLNKSVTGQELNLSQSYITYWHWFDQIVNSQVSELSTGGSFSTALNLFDRYGLMLEADFIPEEGTAEMSARQASALEAVNRALKSGALNTYTARRDRALVRAELDKAWELDESAVRLLDKVFGKTVSKNIERTYTDEKPPRAERDNELITVFRPVDIQAAVKNGTEWKAVTLSDVMGQGGWFRSGENAWQEESYPSSPSARRKFQIRMQRALNDHQPIVISWFVDFNALGRDGSFTLEQLADNPGRQGGHMVVGFDYEVTDVPNFGTLKAGVEETRPEALEAALSPDAKVKFFRIKNSWGAYRPDRWDNAPLPGYHDLYVDYLNGPIRECDEGDTTRCSSMVPLWDVAFPAGY